MEVTGLTADRMIEIENASVVGGSVVGDDLILQRFDTTTFNAGNVRGPTGLTTIPVYDSIINRDIEIPVPTEGMFTYITSSGYLYVYNDLSWVLAGWSKESNRPGVLLTDGPQSQSNAAADDIVWSTEVSDQEGWHAPGSASITVPSGWGGQYSVTYSGLWASSPGATNSVYCSIAGTILYSSQGVSVSGLTPVPVTISFVRTLAAAETIKFTTYQSSGGALNITSRLEIVWLGV